MNTRKALIVGAPDNRIPGVVIDVENVAHYLLSPIGGYWHPHEIRKLISPSEIEIRRELELLKQSSYSLLFFAGHGYYSIERRRTILHINATETLDSLELRVGANKHSLILDCCRKLESERASLKSTMEARYLDSTWEQRLNPTRCREFFDSAISRCHSGIIVMNACAINQTAGESADQGGYYTSSLIDSANNWAKNKLRGTDYLSRYDILTTQDCNTTATAQVHKLSGGRQTPIFECPRVEDKFPFAVVA